MKLIDQNKQKKILLVSPLPPPRGGIGMWTEQVLKEAKKHPEILIEVVDISPRWRNIHQMEIWRRVVGGGVQLVRDVYRISVSIFRDRPDVLHLCTSAQLALIRDIFVLWLANLLGVRSVYHLRFGRLPLLERHGGWEWVFITHSISLADQIVVLDEKSAVTIKEEFPNKKFHQLPNFTDGEQLDRIGMMPNSSDGKRSLLRVTYIGWVIPTKGVLELVEAVVSLSNEIPIELELIGPGDPDYIHSIRTLGEPLGDHLLIKGELPHSEAMLALWRTDIFVLPSYTEGFPNVVIEAMAIGKPVIATDVGAIPEILEASSTYPCGIVIPAKDVEALENSLRELLSDSKQRCIFGERARQRFKESFDAKIVFQSLKEMWSNI